MTEGFYRERQPGRPPIDRAAATAAARAFVAQEIEPGLPSHLASELAFLLLTTDCVDPNGHIFVASCGSVACAHNCGRIVWL